MTFELQHTDKASDARTGIITTDHGQIKTPIFMPVGTAGTVKGVHFEELRQQVKAQIILGNTYHLYLRPGLDILKQAGGLHGFNGWEKPILTDSGGFQVFSLTGIRKLREEGCEFRSHIDGSKHFFTPENVMDTERIIGADIMMALDECPPGQSDYAYAKKSLGMTQRWLDRCIKRFNETEPLYGYNQSLFPIVQGCTYKDLRREAAKFVADKGADGNAIGGLAVGEPTEIMYEMIEVVLTEKWLACVPYLKIMCVVYLLQPIQTAGIQAMKALGNSKLYMNLEIIKKIGGLLILSFTVIKSDSVYAIVVSALIAEIYSTLVNLPAISKLLNYSILEQLRDAGIPVVASMLMYFGVIFFRSLVVGKFNNHLILLIIEIFVGIVIYLLISKALKVDSLSYVKSTLNEVKSRKHENKEEK